MDSVRLQFFTQAPRDLGKVVCATTTLQTDGRAVGDTDAARRADARVAGVVGAVGGALGGAVLGFVLTRFRALMFVPSPILWMASIGLGAWWLARRLGLKPAKPRAPINRFVCAEGFAIFTRSESGIVEQSVRFSDAASLYCGLQRNLNNGSYRNDQLNLCLRDAAGHELFAGVGTWHEKEVSPAWDEIHHLRAIQTAWNAFVLRRLETQWASTGEVQFPLVMQSDGGSRGSLRLSREGLTLQRADDRQQRVTPREGTVTTRDGTLAIGRSLNLSLSDVANVDALQQFLSHVGFVRASPR